MKYHLAEAIISYSIFTKTIKEKSHVNALKILKKKLFVENLIKRGHSYSRNKLE